MKTANLTIETIDSLLSAMKNQTEALGHQTATINQLSQRIEKLEACTLASDVWRDRDRQSSSTLSFLTDAFLSLLGRKQAKRLQREIEDFKKEYSYEAKQEKRNKTLLKNSRLIDSIAKAEGRPSWSV
jgi:hypothetical protein